VTLMGHVDHGKTSLLDALRGSSLAAGEAGGITQAISAFSVGASGGRELGATFIDTPGHELFAAMRERGAHATDLIVLVVALDAGVQDTTREAIRYAKEVQCPLVVAANKVDRPGGPEAVAKLSQQLLEEEVVLEEYGGEVPLVPVSATKRVGLEELLDSIALQAEMLELRAAPDGPAEGTVLESVMGKGLGILSTVPPASARLISLGAPRVASVEKKSRCGWGDPHHTVSTRGTPRQMQPVTVWVRDVFTAVRRGPLRGTHPPG